MFNTVLSQFAAEESEASGFAALGFDVKAFLIQLITFLLVFYILKRYVFGRIIDLLEKRQAKIDEGLKLTSQLTEEKAKLDQEAAKLRTNARKEADALIAATHEQTKTMIREAEATASERAENIVEEARKKIDDETARARRNLEREMVDLVIEATEAVTKEKLDAKKDNALIANALKGRA